MIEIDGQIQWKFFREPEANRWIAESDELGLVLEAITYHDLNDMIIRSMRMLFQDLVDHGELEEFAKAHQWKINGDVPHPPRSVYVDVPFELIAQKSEHDSANRPY